MGLKIVDLLKWKTSVILTGPDGNPILDDNKKPVVVYLRVLNDDDLEKTHRAARLVSSAIRKQLEDTTSETYKDRVEPIIEATREDCIDIIKQYRASNLDGEARVNIVREELPTIEEFAIEPDAPTLEEQEKLDAAIVQQDEDYTKALDEYVKARVELIDAELNNMTTEELQQMAKENISGVIALAEFFTELMAQKLYRGSYIDKDYKIKAFDTLEEFKATDSSIKDQLITAYTNLEFDPDSLKK